MGSVSVIVPTCNRKQRVMHLLANLQQLQYPLLEVIVVDAGEDRLEPADYAPFNRLQVRYIHSPRSVCIQRNTGIRMAQGEWIFLCDDDILVPPDYLNLLMEHCRAHPGAGAVSGLVLQKDGDHWTSQYPLRSGGALLWVFLFQLGIWGEIHYEGRNRWVKKISSWYAKKGNHISPAGWPVVTDFSGEYFATPVFGLGASLIKKDWLLQSPYDEVLDPHGIGDNYGVSLGFPGSIHIVNKAFVYHDHEAANRLERPLQYYRRVLALHYFIKTRTSLGRIKKYRLLWSLLGNLLGFIRVKDGMMTKAAFKSIYRIALGKNPYYRGARENKKVVQPLL